jgi:hypothetical protein
MLYSKDRNDSFFITKNFENCYIGDGNHPEMGRKIYLLYNYQMSVEYVKFERKMELMPTFDTDYDYGDERQVMYLLDIPDEHNEDFKLFLEGKYSQFSEELKTKILKFWDIKDTESIFYGVLYANDAAKENSVTKAYDSSPDEYWPKPVLSREIYMNPN